jgi:predicted nucleic acid-binding protein
MPSWTKFGPTAPLWALEVATVLLAATRRRPIAREAMRERLSSLDMLAIETASQGAGKTWRATVLALAQADDLTVYDAGYLELGIRRGLSLATSDKALRRAAAPRDVAIEPADLV